MKQPLYAGPWVGEFGWELFCWQGFVRAKAMTKTYSYVVIVTRPGNEAIYRDIIDDYGGQILTVEIPTATMNMWKNDDYALEDFKHALWTPTGGEWFKPDNFFRGIPNLSPFYVVPRRNQQCEREADILFHVRNSSHSGTEFRNWSLNHAARTAYDLKDRGLRVASIGKTGAAAHIADTINMLDLSLENLAQVMKSAKLIVGPVSGPIHFAALCQLPRVTWGSHVHEQKRLHKWWNPFVVPTALFTPENSQTYWKRRLCFMPPQDDLIRSILDALDGVYR